MHVDYQVNVEQQLKVKYCKENKSGFKKQKRQLKINSD